MPTRTPPLPLPPKSPTPTNRELAERALNGVRDEAAPPRVSAAKILADALLSPPLPPAEIKLAASGALATARVSARVVQSSDSPPRRQALDGLRKFDALLASTSERAAWPRPERQHQACELEASKLRAEAEATRVVQEAFEFMLKHSR